MHVHARTYVHNTYTPQTKVDRARLLKSFFFKCSVTSLHSFRILLGLGSLWNCRIFSHMKTRGFLAGTIPTWFSWVVGGCHVASLSAGTGKNEAVIQMLCSSILQIFFKNISRPTQALLPFDRGDSLLIQVKARALSWPWQPIIGHFVTNFPSLPLCHEFSFTEVSVHDSFLTNGKRMT